MMVAPTTKRIYTNCIACGVRHHETQWAYCSRECARRGKRGESGRQIRIADQQIRRAEELLREIVGPDLPAMRREVGRG